MSAAVASPLSPAHLAEMARRSLEEDQAADDVTSRAVLDASRQGLGLVVARQNLVVSGTDMAAAVFQTHSSELRIADTALEGQSLAAGSTVLSVHGPCAAILAAERVALNFLQHLCGIASLAAQATQLVREWPVQLLATRKTLPGLRALQRRAAEAGGFVPHRTSLADGILIKDNHLASLGSATPAQAVAAARRQGPPGLPIQVEIDDPADLEGVIAAGADMVLLDNFSPTQVAEAVGAAAGRTILEASGGITLANLRGYAATGVDRISVGFITHSAPAADLSLDLQPAGGFHDA